MTKPIPPLDLSWLLIESPTGTTHVGAMMLFQKPPARRSCGTSSRSCGHTRAAKKELAGVSTEAARTYAVGLVALAGLGASTHLDRIAHPACNLVISDVAGAKEPRYLNGARLLGIYPVSALAASIGLNATLASYHDSMDFGFVANAAALGDLTRLTRHTAQAYAELKRAASTVSVSKH